MCETKDPCLPRCEGQRPGSASALPGEEDPAVKLDHVWMEACLLGHRFCLGYQFLRYDCDVMRGMSHNPIVDAHPVQS